MPSRRVGRSVPVWVMFGVAGVVRPCRSRSDTAAATAVQRARTRRGGHGTAGGSPRAHRRTWPSSGREVGLLPRSGPADAPVPPWPAAGSRRTRRHRPGDGPGRAGRGAGRGRTPVVEWPGFTSGGHGVPDGCRSTRPGGAQPGRTSPALGGATPRPGRPRRGHGCEAPVCRPGRGRGHRGRGGTRTPLHLRQFLVSGRPEQGPGRQFAAQGCLAREGRGPGPVAPGTLRCRPRERRRAARPP
ncbi:hypothetical protein SHIRM173S_12565 [Streptomyces hirsutus]